MGAAAERPWIDANEPAAHLGSRLPTHRGGPSDSRQRVRLRTRGRWGLQGGILAGMAVAFFFFVVDATRLEPLFTPLFLSQVLLLQAGFTAESEGLLQTIGGLSLGGRLAVFTALHLAVFGSFGVMAAATSNLLHLHWSVPAGAVLGFVAGFLLWLAAASMGPSWVGAAHLTREAIVGAGLVGGTVFGWHMRLCRLDAEEGR